MQDTYFGAAIDTDAAEAADAAVDVQLPMVPMVMARDEAGVLHDGPGVASEEWDPDLVAMSVAGEHEVPSIGAEFLLSVGIVVEEDGGARGWSMSEGAFGFDLP